MSWEKNLKKTGFIHLEDNLWTYKTNSGIVLDVEFQNYSGEEPIFLLHLANEDCLGFYVGERTLDQILGLVTNLK